MEKKPTSGLAVTALIMGIIALFSSFVPLLNLLSFPFVLLAIIFGGIGLWQTLGRGKGGKGLAIAGLVLGVVALLITVVMYGAASGAADNNTNDAVFENTSATTEQTDAAGEAAPETPAAEPAPAPAADYAVSIDGCRLAEDYRGNPVAVVTYTFTNNSDKATSFMVAIRPKAFQNGVELDTAIGSDWDNDKWMSEIKTGASTTVEIGYELEDMSDVTVEASETFSFDDTLLAEQTFALS